MAISILTAVYRAHVSEPCARDALRQRLSTAEIMSPEEFERIWDNKSRQKYPKKTAKPRPPSPQKRGKILHDSTAKPNEPARMIKPHQKRNSYTTQNS
jgi:hypothetical protein